MKPDFLIICLGLFLIIILALMIGNYGKSEGFEFIGDLNANFAKLGNNITQIQKHLDKTQSQNLNDLIMEINKYINYGSSANIKFDKESSFLTALNIFQTQLELIPSTNKKELQDLQKSTGIIVNNITTLVNENVKNDSLPLELRKLLGQIWWNCTQIQSSISDRELAKDFKNSYNGVTFYIEPSAFIVDSSDIANAKNIYARKQYLSSVKILRERINLVYQNDVGKKESDKAMKEKDKLKIESDLSNLESYMNTGKFARPV
jgi:hypothetical protein